MPYKKTSYFNDDYSSIYTESENAEEYLREKFQNANIKRYRVKTIKSGDILESEIFPIWKAGSAPRSEKTKTSRNAQKNLNDINTKKKIIRLVNTNFNKKDIWASLTYDKEHLPDNPDIAKKDMQNYLRRLNRHIKKNKLPPLKYIYVTEHNEKRVHHHIIINLSDRDLAERMWNGGGRKHTRRLQPDDFGLEGMARYITKDPNSSKRFTTSRNLDKPKVSIADYKFRMTKKKVERLVKNYNLAAETFPQIYPGYLFKNMEIKHSNFADGIYLYVKMKKGGTNEKYTGNNNTSHVSGYD